MSQEIVFNPEIHMLYILYKEKGDRKIFKANAESLMKSAGLRFFGEKTIPERKSFADTYNFSEKALFVKPYDFWIVIRGFIDLFVQLLGKAKMFSKNFGREWERVLLENIEYFVIDEITNN